MTRKTAALILLFGIVSVARPQPMYTAVCADALFCALSDTLQADSARVTDTLAGKPKQPPPHIPVYRGAYSVNSTFLPSRERVRIGYRGMADLYGTTPFGSVLSLGQPGQPHQPVFYGLGSAGTAFTRNGVIVNEYETGYLNPSFIITEEQDSIEFTPLPRGFLYNSWGAPVTVNLIPSQEIAPRAYSRIRYIQAPNDEGSIDFRLSQFLGRDIGLLVDVANKKAESFYKNSNSSYWGGNVLLRYTPADALTLRLEYGYRSGKTSLNGGVDADSILNTYGGLTTAMFSELVAPVLYRDMYEKSRGQHVALHADARLLPVGSSSLTLYRQATLREFRLNERQATDSYMLNSSTTVYGGLLQQWLTAGPAGITASARADRVTGERAGRVYGFNRFTVSGDAALRLADSSIVPGIFAASAAEAGATFAGVGADAKLRFGERITLYAGVSRNARRVPADTLGSYTETTDALEVSAAYTTHGNVITLSAFRRATSERRSAMPAVNNYFLRAAGYPGTELTLPARNSDGVALCGVTRFGSFEAEVRAVYTRQRVSGDELSTLPELHANAAVWYRDSLFSGSLDLKAGLRATYFSPFRARFFDPYSGTAIGFTGAGTVPGATTVDFSASGEIQKLAIVYFIIENLLDRRYFMVPYYPMPRVGFRFGLAWEFIN